MMTTLWLRPKMEPSSCSDLESSFVERTGTTRAQPLVTLAFLVEMN
jgi:hypothetical protein